MSKEKRVKERAAWHELQIVIRNYRALGMWLVIEYLKKSCDLNFHNSRLRLFNKKTIRSSCLLRFNN